MAINFSYSVIQFSLFIAEANPTFRKFFEVKKRCLKISGIVARDAES